MRRRAFRSGEPSSSSSSAVVEMSVAGAPAYMRAEAARRERIEEQKAIVVASGKYVEVVVSEVDP